MTDIAAALALALIRLTGPDDQVIQINPEEVISIREPRADHGHFPHGTHCLVFTADGKFTAVKEDCTTVSKLLQTGDDRP